MKLTDVIAVWDILHVKDTGDIGFCDLDAAIDKVCGVVNDVPGCQPRASKLGESTDTSTNSKSVPDLVKGTGMFIDLSCPYCKKCEEIYKNDGFELS